MFLVNLLQNGLRLPQNILELVEQTKLLLNPSCFMHLLRHSKELVLQLVEFLERHDRTLADAKVGRYTGLSLDCALFRAPTEPILVDAD